MPDEETASVRRTIVGSLIAVAVVGALSVGTVRWLHMHSLINWRIRPTYPAGQVANRLTQMCAKDYHLTVDARRKDNALQAFFWRVGLLKSDQMEMRPEAADSLERVLLCATRIALSSDARLEFIEVKMADVLTGATVTLWRYVPDIRDEMYTRMGEDEYINRLVIEVDSQGRPELTGRTPDWDPPITMPEFLAKQVVLRAKRQSQVGFQAHEDLSNPATLVVVIDNWSATGEENAQDKAKVADVLEKTAKSVLKGYQFHGFRGLILEDSRGSALRQWSL